MKRNLMLLGLITMGALFANENKEPAPQGAEATIEATSIAQEETTDESKATDDKAPCGCSN